MPRGPCRSALTTPLLSSSTPPRRKGPDESCNEERTDAVRKTPADSSFRSWLRGVGLRKPAYPTFTSHFFPLPSTASLSHWNQQTHLLFRAEGLDGSLGSCLSTSRVSASLDHFKKQTVILPQHEMLLDDTKYRKERERKRGGNSSLPEAWW